MSEKQIAEAFQGIVDIQRHIVGMQSPGLGLGEKILESKAVQSFMSGRGDQARVDLTPREVKTAILQSGAINDIVPSHKPAIDAGTRRKLWVRELLPVFPTKNAAIEMPVKTSGTNGAGIQNRENSAFGESALGFTNVFQPVETIGVFLPASKQILEDSAQLDAFIRGELLHDLATAEEDQLLNGTNVNSELNGMIPAATAYTVQSPQLTNGPDILRDAMKQVESSDFTVTAMILHPNDWYAIEIGKGSSGGLDYAAGDPRTMGAPSLWGVPVITTTAIAAGTFLIGDFSRGAILFDREQPQIELSNHDGTNWVKGMLTIRATQRLSLVIANSLGLVKGSL